MAQLPRISGMLLGAEDLTSDMEIERTKVGIEIEYPRAKMAYACKAFGLDAIDTPFTDVDDEAGLKADTIHAQKLGMNAKTAIHPNQVETINQIFSPTEAQIRWARRIVIADTEAQLKHLGVFSLDGKMIDKPVVDRAKKLLEKAKHYHMLGEISDE
jgi:citrate lyase subunit beta/citryl-CoA lyase